MARARTRQWGRVGVVLVALALAASTGGVPVVASSTTTFSGRATVVDATVSDPVTGTTRIVLADTGALPSQGGAQQASLLSETVPGLLSVDVLHASTVGQGQAARSEASVADLTLTVAGDTVSASFLMTRATAECTPNGPAVSGSADVVSLVVNGGAIDVAAPNTRVTLPNGVLVVDEQSATASSITVNALHLEVSGPVSADVIIASSHADITCATAACPGGDFVTGGGWIAPSGTKDTFAVAGGIRSGAFWGHLEYIDHAGGPKVHGTGVTAYAVTGPTSRHIEGTASINGSPGSYKVDVSDGGEPGTKDTFAITLSTGYAAAGGLGGGNIKLHAPCR